MGGRSRQPASPPPGAPVCSSLSTPQVKGRRSVGVYRLYSTELYNPRAASGGGSAPFRHLRALLPACPSHQSLPLTQEPARSPPFLAMTTPISRPLGKMLAPNTKRSPACPPRASMGGRSTSLPSLFTSCPAYTSSGCSFRSLPASQPFLCAQSSLPDPASPAFGPSYIYSQLSGLDRYYCNLLSPAGSVARHLSSSSAYTWPPLPLLCLCCPVFS